MASTNSATSARTLSVAAVRRARARGNARTMRDLRRVGLLLAAVLLLVLPGASALARTAPGADELVEVVVTLDEPPLAAAVPARTLSARGKRSKLNLRTPASRSYVRTLAAAQRSLQSRIATDLPGARFGWQYSVVLNGFPSAAPCAGGSAGDRTRRGQGLAEPPLPPAPRPQREADQGAGPLRAARFDDRAGDEDRHHRRRNRRVAPLLQPGGLHAAARVPERRRLADDREGHRRARVPAAARDLAQRGQTVRHRFLGARHPRRGNRRGQRRHAHRRGPHHRGRRAGRLPRQLQGLDGAHRGRRRPQRELAGDREGHRDGRQGRDGRHQPLARRARDRAEPRPRRSGARGRGRCRRRPGRGSRERLRGVRGRLDHVAGKRRTRNHGRGSDA